MKSVAKGKAGQAGELLRRELCVLRMVDHPGVVKCYEAFEDSKYVHIVMELCAGGTLLDRVTAEGLYGEQEAAVLVRKIVSAVRHLHALQIAHRDIKPENFLFLSLGNRTDVKLTDFGLARTYSAEEMHTIVGTQDYTAPEVMTGSYTQKCDVWSLGVLLYGLLTGHPPSHSQVIVQ